MLLYEYEQIDVGGGLFFNNSKCKHREVIERRAADGWRYAGWVPTEFTTGGSLSVIDLIFEKEQEV